MTIRKYTNEKGESVEFGRNTPYKVISIDGESAIQNVITSRKNYAQDGESINAMTLDIRPILIQGRLTARSKSELETHRRKLIRVFSPKLKGRYVKLDSAVEYQVECVVEFAPHFASVVRNDKSVNFQISLICPNPYWQDIAESKADISTETGNIEFPLEIPAEGLELSIRTISFITNIYNQGDVDTPIRVTLKAVGAVVNPIIENLDTGEYIRVKRELAEGDTLEINTAFGNKRVEIIKPDGSRENVFHYIDYKSTFFQLVGGDNTIKYDAEVGENNLDVSIYYTPNYLGI